MRAISIEKVTLNIGCGTKTSIDHAKKILENASGRKVVVTKTKKRTTFNVPKNKAIGVKVTVRRGAEELLRRLLEAKDNKLSRSNFDNNGNFAFGVKEYIDIPGMEYDPKIGILGMDVCVTLQRPGYRVKRKKTASRIGKRHRITAEEAMEFAKEKLGVAID